MTSGFTPQSKGAVFASEAEALESAGPSVADHLTLPDELR